MALTAPTIAAGRDQPKCSKCGNGVKDGVEQCDGADLGGATCASLAYSNGGTLGCTANCVFDTSGCKSQAFPATGQTTCWDIQGSVVSCAGTGQDGDLRKGAPLAYVDNGDGTITDANTGLVWEKKSDDGSIHDKDNTPRWFHAFDVHVATHNGMNFAGNVSAAFDTGCTPGCTVLTCSCTGPSFYWSSTTVAAGPSYAWKVIFDGAVLRDGKDGPYHFRAVRGGS